MHAHQVHTLALSDNDRCCKNTGDVRRFVEVLTPAVLNPTRVGHAACCTLTLIGAHLAAVGGTARSLVQHGLHLVLRVPLTGLVRRG